MAQTGFLAPQLCAGEPSVTDLRPRACSQCYGTLAFLGSPKAANAAPTMARTLQLTPTSILTLMGGVYLLRSSAPSRRGISEGPPPRRRASLSEALLEARAALETERRWQGDERANLTRALQQRRRRRRIPPSPYQPKPFVPVATTTTPVATPSTPVTPQSLPVATRSSPLSQLKDFPCALRDFKVAKVTKTCELLCKEATCARA